ncbi:glycosyltransferase family 87 protein [Frigoriglobus tundricola]|uniref:DUF2029 domain-containing protein n=1 Tax=Frigoriglobus tundricola TaxID=2774151 RepID=A0A6M5YFM0_9BACT|nr:glycosyltransferase family 87 protein [Frigoriglobus tundricola]QJW92809.1 hypothetical protein FTUN_0306 [Frigoriglobus tundricola]
MSPRRRSLLVLLVGGLVLAFAADAVVRRPVFTFPRDFLEYWAAGRVNLRGGDPYHPDELQIEQERADPSRTEVVMMWNPPPALAVYMPLGAVPVRWATLVWAGLQLAAVFGACHLLGRTFGRCGPPAPHADRSHVPHRWFAAVAVSFVGTWWLLVFGQNTGFMLLGLAGFFHFTTKDRPRTAGAFAALTALKPHLLAVFGVLLVAGAITRRGRVALATGAAVIAGALGAALAANPAVVSQFVEAARHPAPGAPALSGWVLPAPAYWLRVWLAPDRFWVQFVPCGLACAAFLAYRLWRGDRWDWAREAPLVVTVSVLTTPYGGWIFDLTLLLVPVVAAAARFVDTNRAGAATAFVAGQAAVTAATFAWSGELQAYWWVAPTALVMCLPALGSTPGTPSGDRS